MINSYIDKPCPHRNNCEVFKKYYNSEKYICNGWIIDQPTDMCELYEPTFDHEYNILNLLYNK